MKNMRALIRGIAMILPASLAAALVSSALAATPTITSLSPNSATAGGAAFTLTINGAYFTSKATAKWGATSLKPTYVSSTRLTAPIAAGLIATAGKVNVTVTTTGGTSAGAVFTINPAKPTITSLSPNSATAGGPAFTLTINGAHFTSNATAKWGNTSLTPTYVSSTRLTAPIKASLIATVGTASVTVTTAGGTSAGATFTIHPPPPTITSLSQNAGAVGVWIVIHGTNFGATQGTSTVTFNRTSAGTAIYWDTTSIGVTVPSGATTGYVVVRVLGAASNGLHFTVVLPPSITSLSQTSGAIGAPITITGTSFGATQGTSTVTFNGHSAGTASTWGATSITVTVPVGATTGNVVVTVLRSASNGSLFTVTSPAANCAAAPTGHESMLKGQYAVLAQGYQLAIAASFHADGAGNLSDGEFDINDAAGVTHATVDASSYTVGLDPTRSGNVGCVLLSLSNGSTTAFRFGLGGLKSGVYSRGRIIKFDDPTGAGSRASGVLMLQDATSFALSQLQPHYAFGVDGVNDHYGSHFASAGSFTVNTNGKISNAFADTNDGAGTGGSETTGGSGTINAISSTTGRTTMSLTLGGQTTHQAVYMVNADEFFIIGTDPLSSVPVYSGRAIVTAGSFTPSSLSGNYGIHTTDVTSSCEYYQGGFWYRIAPCPSVNLYLLSLDSISGTYSGTHYWYSGMPGVDIPSQFSGATYAVDPTSGRVTLSSLSGSAVYIATPTANTEPLSAFFIHTLELDGAAFGFAEFQPSQTYSTSALAGHYFYGTEDPGANTFGYEAGVIHIASSGAITGSQYQSGPYGLAAESVGGTVSVGSNGVGGAGADIVAVTNGTRLLLMPFGSPYVNGVPVLYAPVVTVIEVQ